MTPMNGSHVATTPTTPVHAQHGRAMGTPTCRSAAHMHAVACSCADVPLPQMGPSTRPSGAASVRPASGHWAWSETQRRRCRHARRMCLKQRGKNGRCRTSGTACWRTGKRWMKACPTGDERMGVPAMAMNVKAGHKLFIQARGIHSTFGHAPSRFTGCHYCAGMRGSVGCTAHRIPDDCQRLSCRMRMRDQLFVHVGASPASST